MTPGHKPQNSAGFIVTRMALGDMGASSRVRRVTWHTTQSADNESIPGAAPVRPVHYKLRPAGRASEPLHEPASAALQ